jgi:signal transduction histidine kinase/ActR/RegA family two-component response regulator
MTESDAIRILIVDDDDGTRRSFARILQLHGYDVESAGTGQEALAKAQARFFNLVLLDLRLPDGDGVQFIAPLKGQHPDVAILIVTGYAARNTVAQATALGAAGYLTKPLDIDDVVARLRDVLERQRLTIENRRLHQEAHDEAAARAQMEASWRRAAERSQASHEIERALLAEQTPEAIAQVALQHLQPWTPGVASALTLIDFASGELTILAVRADRVLPIQAGMHLPLAALGATRLWFEALAHRETVIVRDLAGLYPASPIHRALAEAGLRACVHLPLISREELVGVMSFGLVQLPDDDDMDAPLAMAHEIAGSLASAIQQSHALRLVNEQCGQLLAQARRLAEVEEAERRRLARELHDRVGQNLTALGINLSIAANQLPPDASDKVRARISDCLALLTDAMGDIRNLMTDLWPSVLDDYGLLAALHWYCQRFTSSTEIATTVIGGELTPRLPLSIETALFRITQEALTNVAQHALADQVTVTFEVEAAHVRLTVADNGIGFDPVQQNQPLEPTRGSESTRPVWERDAGWRLSTMRERAAMIGGRLRVESAPGDGVRIIVEVPR